VNAKNTTSTGSVPERLVRVRSKEATETELAAAIRDAGYTPVKLADAAPAAWRGGTAAAAAALVPKADGSDTAQPGMR
jgi:hypothetical protein